jgi:hypothetical protein
MTFNAEEDEVLSAAIAGLPKIAELIATVPAEDRPEHWRLLRRAICKLRTP